MRNLGVWEDGEEIFPPTLPTLPTLPTPSHPYTLKVQETSGIN
ncbi:hypothetical protein [Nostoc spongiaeforme]|nr:hypothetical protein [Nostoc spongiaeforme]